MHDCQLEKILAFLHGPGQKKGKTKKIYIYIGAMQMFDLYIMYIFIGAKVNHTSSKNAGQENPTW